MRGRLRQLPRPYTGASATTLATIEFPLWLCSPRASPTTRQGHPDVACGDAPRVHTRQAALRCCIVPSQCFRSAIHYRKLAQDVRMFVPSCRRDCALHLSRLEQASESLEVPSLSLGAVALLRRPRCVGGVVPRSSRFFSRADDGLEGGCSRRAKTRSAQRWAGLDPKDSLRTGPSSCSRRVASMFFSWEAACFLNAFVAICVGLDLHVDH